MLKAVLHALFSSEVQDTPLPIGLDTPGLVGRSVELCRNSRPPQHIDPHPDPGGAHAFCPRAQVIRRDQPNPLPHEMAGGTRPYRKRKG